MVVSLLIIVMIFYSHKPTFHVIPFSPLLGLSRLRQWTILREFPSPSFLSTTVRHVAYRRRLRSLQCFFPLNLALPIFMQHQTIDLHRCVNEPKQIFFLCFKQQKFLIMYKINRRPLLKDINYPKWITEDLSRSVGNKLILVFGVHVIFRCVKYGW